MLMPYFSPKCLMQKQTCQWIDKDTRQNFQWEGILKVNKVVVNFSFHLLKQIGAWRPFSIKKLSRLNY